MITLGLEEEVQVVDAYGELTPHDFTVGDLTGRAGEGAMDREIHRCVIELKTRICHGVPDLLAALGGLRRQARQRTAQQGQQILIAGVHPTARWQEQAMHLGPGFPHYTNLVSEYQDISRSAFSFGTHLHLGFEPGTPRMAVMNRLRHVLPEALALSASSPFFEGRDTGLASWRHSLLDRYPRMGTPDTWPSEAAYEAHVQRLRRTGCIHADQGLWQDLRLHHRYGTLEVRVMDTHPELARIGLIATLLKWEAETLEIELRHGRAGPPWERSWIDENKWRARRYGLAAHWIDWDREEVLDTGSRFERWWSRVAPRAAHAAERQYWERELADALAEGSFADRMRRQAAIDDDWSATLAWMVGRTEDDDMLLAHAEGWS